MPKPDYILLAESYSQDATTGLLSVFHVLEGLTFSVGPTDETGAKVLSVPAKPTFYGLATWSRTEDDGEDFEYEYENQQASPDSGDFKTINCGEFIFSKTRHRFIVGFVISMPWKKSGNFIFRSRIRGKNEGEWISQEYSFPVTVDLQEAELTEDKDTSSEP